MTRGYPAVIGSIEEGERDHETHRGRTAIAGPDATSSAVGKKKVKKIATKQASKQIDARLPWGTQDIADGAVTGAKVADGSLTGADLTAGTGATIQGGGDTSVPGGLTFMSPIGRSEATAAFAGLGNAVAPVNLTLRNLRVVTDPPGAGNSINVRLVSSPPGAPNITETGVGCTVSGSATACSSNATGSVAAGRIYFVGLALEGVNAVPVTFGYTAKPQ